MAHVRFPKPYSLTKRETVASFEAWLNNQLCNLNLEPTFAPFLVRDAVWLAESDDDHPHRGLLDDPAGANARTAAQKCVSLELMLGQIASYAPVIARAQILNCTRLSEIWADLRLHYGFLVTGTQIFELMGMKLEPEERYEDLYQRILACVSNNLLKAGGSIAHKGTVPARDEVMTPTLDVMVSLLWLSNIY